MNAPRRRGRPVGYRHRILSVLAVTLLIALFPGPGGHAGAATTTNEQVSIIVTQLTPKVLAPDSVIKVRGVLTNQTSQPLTQLHLRLQTGDVLTSRFALHVAENEPPADETGWCDFESVTDQLGPGASVSFSSTCPAAQLGLAAAGVYPLKINVNARQSDLTEARVGEADTFLPYFPQAPKAPTKVAWLWPVTDRPHQFEDGTFADDDLAGALAPSGFLYRLLDIPASATDVPITLALDPRLVSEVQAMTRGYHVHVGSKAEDGRGRQVAQDWMDTLRSLIKRDNVSVVALPYGDPDLVTLAKMGLTERISFAFDRSATLLSQLLGVKHPLPVIWPPEGALNDQTLYALSGLSYSGLVLGSDALPHTNATITPDAVTTIETQGGAKTALTSDRALDNLAARTEFPNGPRLGEQRFMSELAMITAEAPNDARSVLITPPRRWNVPDQYARAMLAASTGRWSTGTAVGDLLDAPRSPQPSPLTYPGPAPSPTLSITQQQKIAEINKSLDDFRNVLSNSDANTVLTPYYESLLATSSAAFRTETQRASGYADDLIRRSAALRNTVRIIVPLKGTYSLASSSSPLIITVLNQLPVDVTVRVQLTARGSAGFHAEPVEKTVPGGNSHNSRLGVHVPTHVERSGVFAVTAQVTTRSGTTLGKPVTLRVRSTAYGGITLGITGGALGLLVILVAIRLYRRIRAARHRTTPIADAAPGPTP